MVGTHAVFTVTNYWDKMDMQLEIQQGKNLADAAKENGVQHFIWSSLLNVTKRTYISCSSPLPLPFGSNPDVTIRHSCIHTYFQ